jgi:hypothetical protein
MKKYHHIKVIDMSTKRDHYTQHGLNMNKTGKEWITRKMADVINKLFINLKPAHIHLKWKEMDQEDPVKYNEEAAKEAITPEINPSTPTMTRLIQKETGNKPKQSTRMRKECGIQVEKNVMDQRNTSQRNRNIKSTQNNANRNIAERLNQIEDETSSDNNDVRNDEDCIPLQTPYTTSIDSTVYPSSESPNGKTKM